MKRIGIVSLDGTIPDFSSLGVAAAIVDTGIDRRHPELNVVGGRNLVSSDPNGDPYHDGLGHGTHVAGILGAKNNGQGIVGAAPGAARNRAGGWGGSRGRRASEWASGPCRLPSCRPLHPCID
jgi:subtilisin